MSRNGFFCNQHGRPVWGTTAEAGGLVVLDLIGLGGDGLAVGRGSGKVRGGKNDRIGRRAQTVQYYGISALLSPGFPAFLKIWNKRAHRLYGRDECQNEASTT